MRILGIETATSICSAAILDGDRTLADHTLHTPQMHSEKLLPLIDECFSDAALTLRDIDGIAVSIGPGSFTGLRIGLSVSKGLSFASGKPLVGVPSLEALAFFMTLVLPVADRTAILPVIDARRNEVYAALYHYTHSGGLREIHPSTAVAVEDLETLLSANGALIVVGDGAEKAGRFLKTHPRFGPAEFHPEIQPHARAVAALGEGRLRDGKFADAGELEPLYGKEFYTTMKPIALSEVR